MQTLKVHARIVWSLSFSHDSAWLVSGSRDKKMMLFAKEEGLFVKKMEKGFGSPVTAVAFADKMHEGGYWMAVGLENGLL